MRLSPDELIYWQHGIVKLNATIVFTWGLMLVLAAGSLLITRNLSSALKRSRWQGFLEIVVTTIEKQIAEVGLRHPEKYLGFLGTLFLFVASASLFTVIPGYHVAETWPFYSPFRPGGQDHLLLLERGAAP